MFRTRDTPALIFKWDKPKLRAFTAWFVFFPFVIQWWRNYELIEERIVKPWEFMIVPKSRQPFDKIVEIPIKESAN